MSTWAPNERGSMGVIVSARRVPEKEKNLRLPDNVFPRAGAQERRLDDSGERKRSAKWMHVNKRGSDNRGERRGNH